MFYWVSRPQTEDIKWSLQVINVALIIGFRRSGPVWPNPQSRQCNTGQFSQLGHTFNIKIDNKMSYGIVRFHQWENSISTISTNDSALLCTFHWAWLPQGLLHCADREQVSWLVSHSFKWEVKISELCFKLDLDIWLEG